MRYLKKGLLVRCSNDPNRIDIYNLKETDEGKIVLEPVENEILETDFKEKIRFALKVILDFFYYYTNVHKENPRIEELIVVLAYELGIEKEEAWKIFDFLNYYGIVLLDRNERIYLNIP